MSNLSIIIPTLNEERYLPELLKSIKYQTYKDFEIIIADAGSTDNTVSIARKNGCKIVEGGHTEIGKNNGAKVSKSPILCFIDSDIVLPNKKVLAQAIEEFKKRNLDFAGTYQKPLSLGDYTRDIFYLAFYSIANLGMNLAKNTKHPLAQSLIFAKREAFLDIKFPSHYFGEDSELVWLAVSKGYKFGMISSVQPVLISPRRIERNGIIKMSAQYLAFNAMRSWGYKFERTQRRRSDKLVRRVLDYWN